MSLSGLFAEFTSEGERISQVKGISVTLLSGNAAAIILTHMIITHENYSLSFSLFTSSLCGGPESQLVSIHVAPLSPAGALLIYNSYESGRVLIFIFTPCPHFVSVFLTESGKYVHLCGTNI